MRLAAIVQVLFADCAPVPLSHLLPDASPAALGLLQHLLQWNPGESSGGVCDSSEAFGKTEATANTCSSVDPARGQDRCSCSTGAQHVHRGTRALQRIRLGAFGRQHTTSRQGPCEACLRSNMLRAGKDENTFSSRMLSAHSADRRHRWVYHIADT